VEAMALQVYKEIALLGSSVSREASINIRIYKEIL